MSKPSPSAPRPGKSKAAPAPKPFNAREQLAMAKSLRSKKKADCEDAVTLLTQAIARHQRHMDGTEATDNASQMKMMEEMKAALAALISEEALGKCPSRCDAMESNEAEE